jgi:hypothetical protein
VVNHIKVGKRLYDNVKINESSLVDLLMNRDIEYKKRIVIEKWNKKNTGGSKEGRKSCFALLAS